MIMHRRTFVATATHASVSVALAATLPRTLPRSQRWRRQHEADGTSDVLTLYDPQVKALALSAIDAARHAGANYADVRISYTRNRSFSASNQLPYYNESEVLGLSVRALVDGYWGWAATSYVAASEAPRVAQAAVGLAKGNAATGQRRPIDWTPIPVVTDGTWTTPIREDPFQVAIPQVMDWVEGIRSYIEDTRSARPQPAVVEFSPFPWVVALTLQQQQRVFASTEGSYLTQTVYVTDPHVGFQYNGVSVVLPIRPAQIGYEYVTDTPWAELIRQGRDRADDELRHPLPVKVVDIGRYNVVFGAAAMASLVAQTLGTAAQVDRALGYEANAGGSSYLGPDPLTILGTAVASPLVTVTADRTSPRSIATTQWDEEGVRSESFSFVQAGILQDYQTTREQAGWLAPYYAKTHRPVRSHGCAAGTDALTQQMQHMPNLTLEPGKDALGVEELVASVDDGLLVEDVSIEMDFQALTGLAYPTRLIQIRRGKRIAQMGGARIAVAFRSTEFWKNILTLGGPQSVESLYPMTSAKGEPEQQVRSSVSAVPAVVKQLAVIDYTK